MPVRGQGPRATTEWPTRNLKPAHHRSRTDTPGGDRSARLDLARRDLVVPLPRWQPQMGAVGVRGTFFPHICANRVFALVIGHLFVVFRFVSEGGGGDGWQKAVAACPFGV